MVIFVTGGARSGKSDFAQDLAEKLNGKRLFLATAQALDEEMSSRIQKHQKRRGNRWDTLEEPIYIGRALRSAVGSYKIVLIDCLTIWMSNLLGEYPDQDEKISEILADFFLSINEFEGTIIAVSNEVGMGIVPDNKISRAYRDRLGFLNQAVARKADKTYLLFSGIPVKIK